MLSSKLFDHPILCAGATEKKVDRICKDQRNIILQVYVLTSFILHLLRNSWKT